MLAAFCSLYKLYRANISSVCWQTVISLLILDKLPKCYFCFQCCGISPRVPLMTVKYLRKCLSFACFAGIWDLSIPFSTITLLTACRSAASLTDANSHLDGRSLSSPTVSSLFSNAIRFDSDFTPSVTTFYFFVALSSALVSSLFCKTSHGFIADRLGGHLATHLVACVWTGNRRPVTSHRQTSKEVVWLSLIVICMHPLLMYWFSGLKPDAEFVLYAVTHSCKMG